MPMACHCRAEHVAADGFRLKIMLSVNITLIIIIIIIIITRFQSEDQVCISTTLRDLDKSVLTRHVDVKVKPD